MGHLSVEHHPVGEGVMILLTFRSSLVLFLALAIIDPSLTKTQPTGTSPAANASSAWKGLISDRCGEGSMCPVRTRAYHCHGFSHPFQVFLFAAGHTTVRIGVSVFRFTGTWL